MSSGNAADSRPCTKPLTSVAELRAWQPGTDDWNKASEQFKPRYRQGQEPNEPLLMHCHDAGHYDEYFDKYPGGAQKSDVYNFHFWQYVDTFVYFGHDRIMIPPPGWTNTAHRHGVTVLGNFIVEPEGNPPEPTVGKAELKEILDNQNLYINKFVAIADYYGFDGWFFNIEVGVDQPESLQNFFAVLKHSLAKQHSHRLVIFYNNQKHLDSSNLPYLENSSGLFLDYGWANNSLRESVRIANPKTHTLYAGIDVWKDIAAGRSGEGFDTYKKVKEAVEAGASIGLFAAKWTLEKRNQNGNPATFEECENQLWIGKADNHCTNTQCISQFISERPLPYQLPFVTNFNQGKGTKRFSNGQLGKEGEWCNMGEQSLQPTWRFCQAAGDEGTFKASFSYEQAFNGGTSLEIQCANTTEDKHSFFKLFKTNYLLEKPLSASYTLLNANSEQSPQLCLVLLLDDRTALFLTNSDPSKVQNMRMGDEYKPMYIQPSSSANANSWETRTYLLDNTYVGRTVKEIWLLAYTPSPTRSSVFLGEITLS